MSGSLFVISAFVSLIFYTPSYLHKSHAYEGGLTQGSGIKVRRGGASGKFDTPPKVIVTAINKSGSYLGVKIDDAKVIDVNLVRERVLVDLEYMAATSRPIDTPFFKSNPNDVKAFLIKLASLPEMAAYLSEYVDLKNKYAATEDNDEKRLIVKSLRVLRQKRDILFFQELGKNSKTEEIHSDSGSSGSYGDAPGTVPSATSKPRLFQ